MTTQTKKILTAAAECANCAVLGVRVGVILKLCSKCKLVSYCSKECQLQHWREGGHKRFCIAAIERVPSKNSESDPTIHQMNENDNCVICREKLIFKYTCTLQCGHSFHQECISNHRKFGSSETCPLCRAPLSCVFTKNVEKPLLKNLMMASTFGDESAVRALLADGADCNEGMIYLPQTCLLTLSEYVGRRKIAWYFQWERVGEG
jgi:hypothetical protein